LIDAIDAESLLGGVRLNVISAKLRI